jgi:tetratricopeptide (TPR) repeat protein
MPNNKKYKQIICIIYFILFYFSLYSFYGDFGTEPLFESGVGARPVAMGNAYTALADDVASIYYNPAGLSLIKAQEIIFLHYPLYEDALYNAIAYAQTLLDFGTIGLALYRYNAGTISGYDSNDKKTEDFIFEEYKATISYARNLENKFYIGANINFLNSFIKNNGSLGFGVDFGVLYEPFDFLRLGFVLHNLIRPIQTIGTEKEGIPQLYILGILLTKELGFLKINITNDFSIGETENLKIRFGTEFIIYKFLNLRAGYDAGRYVLGSGVDILNGSVNYTFIINDYLENLHRIDILYRFGLSLDEQKVRKKNEIMNQVRKIVEEKLKLKEKQMATKHYTSAYNYYKEGNYENALKEAEKSLEWDKGTKGAIIIKRNIAKIYFSDAMRFYKAGKYIEALEKLKNIVSITPDYDEVDMYIKDIISKLEIKEEARENFNAGIDLYTAKDYAGAIKLLQKVLLLDHDNKNVKILLAEARQKLQSGQIQTEISKSESEEIKKMYYDGINAYTDGDLEKAISIWSQGLSKDPNNIKLIRGIEKAKLELEEYKKRGF